MIVERKLKNDFLNCEDLIKAVPISITIPLLEDIPDAEGLIAYQARVSNEGNQLNFATADKLLAYCAREKHWSIFAMANFGLEITVPRDISRQILRHKSLDFQEFSGRYAEYSNDKFCLRECRLQDPKNRQNSILCEDDVLSDAWVAIQEQHLHDSILRYNWALKEGIAKEVARVLLPEGMVMSKMYVNGTVRSWIHYCQVRQKNGTQKEHSLVADLAADAFAKYFPSLASHVDRFPVED